ncbi:MAG: hypothetical protein AAGM67_07885 [Bacteroidota bacterium]
MVRFDAPKSNLNDQMLRKLSYASWFSNLELLDISHNPLTDVSLTTLDEARFRQMDYLNLDGIRFRSWVNLSYGSWFKSLHFLGADIDSEDQQQLRTRNDGLIFL